MPKHFPIASRWMIFCLLGLGLCCPAAGQQTGMVEFFASGKLQKGLALVDLAHEMVVLGRDGWMHSLDPTQPEAKIRPLDERFQPTSATELRNELRAEFGRSFEVLTTRNFIVVQPQGRGDRWPRLFESSHRAFVDYMSKRGVTVREGRSRWWRLCCPTKRRCRRNFKNLGSKPDVLPACIPATAIA